MAHTTTKAQPACHFGDGAAVAVLTYQLPNHPRRSHYRVCEQHYTEFSQANLVQVRWLDWAAGKRILAALP